MKRALLLGGAVILLAAGCTQSTHGTATALRASASLDPSGSATTSGSASATGSSSSAASAAGGGSASGGSGGGNNGGGGGVVVVTSTVKQTAPTFASTTPLPPPAPVGAIRNVTATFSGAPTVFRVTVGYNCLHGTGTIRINVTHNHSGANAGLSETEYGPSSPFALTCGDATGINASTPQITFAPTTPADSWSVGDPLTVSAIFTFDGVSGNQIQHFNTTAKAG